MTSLYENPEYKREKDDLVRYRDMYEGDHDTMVRPEYLWYTPVERKNPADAKAKAAIVQIRMDREQRSRYLNIPEIIVSLWTSLLFRKPYSKDEEAEATLKDIEDDIDGKGTSFWDFLKDECAESLFVFGKVFVLTDTYIDGASSRTDEKAKGMRPFVELLNPLDCKDWQIESAGKRAGKYKFFRYEYCVLEDRNSPEDEPKEIRRSDALIQNGDTVEVLRYEQKSEKTSPSQVTPEQGHWEKKADPIKLGVPDMPLSTIVSESWIHEVCEETLRHFNSRSVKDTIEFTQGFTRMFVKGVDPSSAEQIDALSNYTISILPADGDVIAVPPTSTADLKASVEEAIDNAFKVGLNKLRSLPSSSKENESADSQAQDKENIYALAESTVAQIERLANDILKHIAAFRGIEGDPGKITLSREFSKESFSEWVVVFSTIRDLLKGYPEIEKAAFKKAVGELNLDSDVMERIDSIIDNGPQKSEPDSQRTSILGRFLNGREGSESTEDQAEGT